MSREYVRADKPQGHGWNTVRMGFLKAAAGRTIGTGFPCIRLRELQLAASCRADLESASSGSYLASCSRLSLLL